MVNTPDAVWRALYVGGKDGKPSEILINSSHKFKPGDLSRSILHEIIHHGTLAKLGMPEHMLTPGQLAAKQELQKVYDEIRGRKDIAGLMGTKNFVEFASEVFSNDKFRQRLNALSEDGKTSYFTRIKDAINRLLFGEHDVREGSLLDKAMRETLNVVGGEHMESESLAERAARMRAKEGADLVNAHPAHQEAIADLIAPMAENMGITKAEQQKDEPDWHPERAFYSDKERAFLEPEIDRQAKLPKIKASKAEVAKLKKDVETYMITNRAYKPANRGWATGEIGINEALNKKEGWAGGVPTPSTSRAASETGWASSSSSSWTSTPSRPGWISPTTYAGPSAAVTSCWPSSGIAGSASPTTRDAGASTTRPTGWSRRSASP